MQYSNDSWNISHCKIIFNFLWFCNEGSQIDCKYRVEGPSWLASQEVQVINAAMFGGMAVDNLAQDWGPGSWQILGNPSTPGFPPLWIFVDRGMRDVAVHATTMFSTCRSLDSLKSYESWVHVADDILWTLRTNHDTRVRNMHFICVVSLPTHAYALCVFIWAYPFAGLQQLL